VPTVWRLHGDGRTVDPGAVVAPGERLAWPGTIGIGIQHVLAMFGATFLVPVLIGFPPSTTIFFSGIATLLFLVVTRNRVPSYLGSSFAFIAPVIAAKAGGGISAALGGVLCTGAAFFVVGLIVDRAGSRVIEIAMPPVVTGTVVALIGLNLAGSAKTNFFKQPIIGVITLGAILLVGVLLRGLIGRLYIVIGVIIGWIVAGLTGQAPVHGVASATWVGLPPFHLPTFHPYAIALIVPAVVAITAENTGHVKAVALMTGRNLDDTLGRAYMGDGLGTMIAGAFGGSATTTYAENIGVMAATRVYSTAAYPPSPRACSAVPRRCCTAS
jgi:NCS2 family nucleobase:cation symporter-2